MIHAKTTIKYHITVMATMVEKILLSELNELNFS